mmetsp:Transcript_7656/g.23318  ORF Transcript_7656/g.23318 Transcript_7656/m.23318 type:complete len:342 (+) Transcript_7656:20-1045(+)
MRPRLPRLAAAAVRRRLSSRHDRDRLLEVHQGLVSVLNTTARVLGVRHRLSVAVEEEEVAKEDPPSGGEVGAEVPRLQNALRYMTQSDIEAYVERLVGSGRLGDFEGLPLQQSAGVERFVYSHCVKILLCVMHEALDRVTGAQVFGLRVALSEQTARAKLDLLGSLERRLEAGSEATAINVDVKAVSGFVDRVVEVERESGNAIFGYPALERILHYNVTNIVLNLLADASSTYRFDFFGHSLRLAVDPNDALHAVSADDLRAHREKGPSIFDDAFIDALVDEILSDKDINLWLVPDYLERSFYRRFFSFYSLLLDYALGQVRLSILDVDARLRFERDHPPR